MDEDRIGFKPVIQITKNNAKHKIKLQFLCKLIFFKLRELIGSIQDYC